MIARPPILDKFSNNEEMIDPEICLSDTEKTLNKTTAFNST